MYATSLSSIPLEQFLPLAPLVSCSKGMALQDPIYVGSLKIWHWGPSQEDQNTLESSKYEFYALHLSNESFPKNVIDLEGVKNDWFPLMYSEFNVWKKVGNSCSTVLSCTAL